MHSDGLLSPFLVVLPEAPLELGDYLIDFEMSYDKDKSSATPRIWWTVTGSEEWREIQPSNAKLINF